LSDGAVQKLTLVTEDTQTGSILRTLNWNFSGLVTQTFFQNNSWTVALEQKGLFLNSKRATDLLFSFFRKQLVDPFLFTTTS